MSKGNGNIRISHWGSVRNYIGDMYVRDGRRVEYSELTTEQKKVVKTKKSELSKELYASLKDVTTPQVIDDNVSIDIHYTSKGLDHFANSAMLTLSGKYFSEKSMKDINNILSKSQYIPTSHELIHPRTDGRDLWFAYKDADSRGVYFKIAWNSKLKFYELYDVVDKM